MYETIRVPLWEINFYHDMLFCGVGVQINTVNTIWNFKKKWSYSGYSKILLGTVSCQFLPCAIKTILKQSTEIEIIILDTSIQDIIEG